MLKKLLPAIIVFLLISLIFFIYWSQTQNQFYPPLTLKLDVKEMWGRPAKNLFPEINNPKFVSAKEADQFLNDEDEVFTIKKNKETIVYPLLILSFHHIVNDLINNQPVAVTYCLLADVAFSFSRQLNDKVLQLGVLGPLYFGNLVMYDKETDSYILQLTGDIFHGKLQGKRLSAFKPMERIKWKYIKNSPSLKVLSPINEIGFYRDFYEKRKGAEIGLNSLKQKGKPIDSRLPPLTKGFGINVGNDSLFIPFSYLEKKELTNEAIGNLNILVFFDKNTKTYKLWRRDIDGKTLKFYIQNNSLLDRETKSTWSSEGLAIKGALKWKQLLIPNYIQVYWYVLSAFFPKSKFL